MNNVSDFLVEIVNVVRPVADETGRVLGDDAFLFVNLHADFLAIHGAVRDRYPDAELLQSLLFAQFQAFFRDLPWRQFDFLASRYALLGRNLRFVWEWMFRSYYADRYKAIKPNATDGPALSADDKMAWLEAHERALNWKTVFEPVLTCLGFSPDFITSRFKCMWDGLNRCAHPAASLLDRLVDDSALLVRDGFDEKWARETLADAAEVFGLIWLAVLHCFPAAVPDVIADARTFRVCPHVRAILEGWAPR